MNRPNDLGDAPDEFLRAARFSTVIEAELAHATLAAAGIDSVIVADDTGHMIPPLQQSGVDLLVRGADLAEARTILTTPASDPAL